MHYRAPRTPSLLAVAVALLTGAAGCDGAQRGRDAAAPGQRIAEVSVRVEVPAENAPSVSLFAFQALVNGSAGATDVLGVVDPLVAAPPVRESACERRAVGGAAQALAAHGGQVELEALPEISLLAGDALPALHPVSRIFPELPGISGVFSEADPVDLPAVPARLSLAGGAPDGAALPIDLPAAPRLLREDGSPLPASERIPLGRELVLTVEGLPGTFVELRPLYATSALACPVVAHTGKAGKVVVPAEALAALGRPSGSVPVSVEAVWRESRPVSLRGRGARLSLELRSSTVVGLGQ